jgi:hypothetical protein
VLAACGNGSKDDGALAGLTEGQLAEYNSTIDAAGATAGFELVRPSYLPLGTDWLPSTDYIALSKEATMSFYPNESVGATFEQPYIHIVQALDLARQICPPCAERDSPDLERHLQGNTELILQQGRSAERRVFLAIYFRRGDIWVMATFDWQLQPGMSEIVTNEMKTEALKVVRSMSDPTS